MDTRELLAKAIVGVIKQGRPSRDSGFCMYRAPGGLKCAVGHLIDDAHYSSSFEGESIGGRGATRAVARSIGREFSRREFEFLKAIQACHDEADEDRFVDSFINRIGVFVRAGDLPVYCLDIIAEAQQ